MKQQRGMPPTLREDVESNPAASHPRAQKTIEPKQRERTMMNTSSEAFYSSLEAVVGQRSVPTAVHVGVASLILSEFATTYMALDESQYNTLEQRLLDLGLAISMSQAESLRVRILHNQAIACHELHQPAKQKLFRDLYEQGRDVLSLAREFNLPPMGLFRAIVAARLIETVSIASKDALKRRIKTILQSPEETLSERDCRELRLCEAHDIITGVMYQQAMRVHAQEFENQICDIVRRTGAVFISEEEQKAGGIIHGEATPDLLFESPITINGQEVFWIDAKDYFGTSLPGVQTKSMLKQVERYRTSFGPGALVFSLGCAEDIRPFAWNCGAIVLAEEDLIDCLS